MEGVGRLGMLLIRTQIMVKRLKCYWNKFKYCSYYVPCKPRVGKGNLSASFKRVFTRSCYIQRFRCRPGRFWDRTFYFSVLGAKFLGSVSITSYWKKPYRGQESVCASLHEKYKIPVESESFVCLSVCVLLYLPSAVGSGCPSRGTVHVVRERKRGSYHNDWSFSCLRNSQYESVIHGEVVYWNHLELSSSLGRRRKQPMSWFYCFSINSEIGLSHLMYWSGNLRK